jgi:hypothetical protein
VIKKNGWLTNIMWFLTIVFFIPLTPIAGAQFEYCIPKKDSGLANDMLAGTPVPMEPVILGPVPTLSALAMLGSAETQVPNASAPIPEPTATPQVYNEFNNWQVEAVGMGQIRQSNFHIVVVGTGFKTPEENEAKLRGIISGLETNFKGVNIDFVYIRNPVDINLKHADQVVNFSDEKDFGKLLTRIKSVYPADGVAIAVETSTYLGASNTLEYSLFTATDPNVIGDASHEIGHLLGMGDGYMRYYKPGELPDSELFYSDDMPDDMPRILSDALKKLGTVPPIHEAGTCKGRKLYQFYESSNNIYGNYNPQGPNPWGDTFFTPLQIIEMNDYIAALK